MILRPHAPKARALPTELHPDISVTTGSRTQMVSLPSELKSDASRQFRHSDISLSFQQSTVFPICQYSSTYPSANGLVGIIGFEPIRLSTLEFESSVAANFTISPYLPVFPGCQPRAGHFRRKKYHDTSLIILTKITIKCLFYFSSSADLHKTRFATE